VLKNIVKVLTETKLQSNKLKMQMIEQEKVALSNTDDKRVWIRKYEEFGATCISMRKSSVAHNFNIM
jgi:hypothetical protein